MRYGSVCSGIEAASVAWGVLGWEASWLSEIEAFPSAVLAHHYPDVPNHGDMTAFQEWPDDAIDLLVGGTPCQSFSVAGLRAGLADPRGNLMLTYLAIAAKYQPRWLVWENVPGVLSSNGGRDFGTFLRGLVELGYGFAYRVLDAQYCRASGFPRAVPQRRKRVFVVGYLGDWRRAAAVLFDGSSLRGDPAPRREAGQGTAGDIALSVALRGRDGGGTAELGDDCGLALRASTGGGDKAHVLVAHAVQAGAMRENPDAGPDGVGVQGDYAYTLEARAEVQAVAFNWQASGKQTTLGANGDTAATIAVGTTQAVAFETRPINTMVGLRHEALGEGTGLGIGATDDPAFTLSKAHSHAVQSGWDIRRLTPRECERLQGFPDDYTLIPFRKKQAADGPRYKALGNSMAVNVMRVIGSRIQLVEAA